jgi:hypothetical protein
MDDMRTQDEGKRFIHLNQRGRIPEHTDCPFKSKCSFAASGKCHHEGINHGVEFSCATARGFDLIERNKLER